MAKLGAWLQLAPVLGMIGTIFGMAKAFNTLASSGAGDPEKLSAAIGDVLIITMIAVSLSSIGLVLVTIAITICRYRERWMFQFLCFYGLLAIGLNLCLLAFQDFRFNHHLAFGIFFLSFALTKKPEFQRTVSRKLPSCYSLD